MSESSEPAKAQTPKPGHHEFERTPGTMRCAVCDGPRLAIVHVPVGYSPPAEIVAPAGAETGNQPDGPAQNPRIPAQAAPRSTIGGMDVADTVPADAQAIGPASGQIGAESWAGMPVDECPQGLVVEAEALRADYNERIRRHEADLQDLEQARITARDEAQRAREAEVQVGALADACEMAMMFGSSSAEVIGRMRAALKLAGRV